MTEEEKQLFTAQEAADFVSEHSIKRITVPRLAQLRRDEKTKHLFVGVMVIGYNTTIFPRGILEALVDYIGRKPGTPGKSENGIAA